MLGCAVDGEALEGLQASHRRDVDDVAFPTAADTIQLLRSDVACMDIWLHGPDAATIITEHLMVCASL